MSQCKVVGGIGACLKIPMKVLIQFEKNPLLFEDPEYLISAYDPQSFKEAFPGIEKAIEDGYHLAGFFSYEAGYYFEESLADGKTRDFPLIYLGAYKDPPAKKLCAKNEFSKSMPEGIKINIEKRDYFANIEKIRDYIAQGDVYQITYCIKLLFEFSGNPLLLYNLLLKEQPVPYPAYIDAGTFQILSCSPEMFIKKESGFTVTKPMKGTWQRGDNLISDFLARMRFQYDSKNRAENVMIADLLRNDLGRVGSRIRAPRLFEVAGYNTLFQMTSTVTGSMDKDIPIYRLFSSLFPSGSVTGAPKIRAMQIIREIEREERKIYTGAIGYIAPTRDIFFNIPIRTLLIQGGIGEMGIGGGIVWDSTPQGEWDEGMLKAKFLTSLSQTT